MQESTIRQLKSHGGRVWEITQEDRTKYLAFPPGAGGTNAFWGVLLRVKAAEQAAGKNPDVFTSVGTAIAIFQDERGVTATLEDAPPEN